MKPEEFDTKNEINWCPGCTDYFFLIEMKKALSELVTEKKIKKEQLVSVGDIGCGAKMFDYLNISGINGLHGRTIPTCLGIKLGNPNLKVMGFAGDGGTYDEGLDHLIHNCRYNSDFNLFVINNQIFALTVGQATAVTEEGFKEKTNPAGVKEAPLNPLVLALESGASFVARLNIFDIEKSKEIIKKAIMHKGFSFIEVMQPCIKFHDFSLLLKENSYYVGETKSFSEHPKVAQFKQRLFDVNTKTREEAINEARKWNYGVGKIPVGIFIQDEKDSFESKRNILSSLIKDGAGFGDIVVQKKF